MFVGDKVNWMKPDKVYLKALVRNDNNHVGFQVTLDLLEEQCEC